MIPRSDHCRTDDPAVHGQCDSDVDTCGCSCHAYLADLRTAYEKLSRASTWATSENQHMLTGALQRIAYVGAEDPSWSKHMQPMPVPDPQTQPWLAGGTS